MIAHVHLVGDTYTTVSSIRVNEIPAKITPSLADGSPLQSTTALIFPDSGASICLAGAQHLDTLRLQPHQLIPCQKKVMAVGGSILTCRGWIMTSFKVSPLSTTHRLYICDKVDRIYFSKDACTAVGILPKSFPFPMQPNIASEKPDKPTMNAVQARTEQPTTKPTTSQRVRLPYPPKEENIGNIHGNYRHTGVTIITLVGMAAR